MKINIDILNQKEYQEMYYLHILRRLHEGFFQKRGFNVFSTAIEKNGSEVVFPKHKILEQSAKLDKFFNSFDTGEYNYTFPQKNRLERYKDQNIHIEELVDVITENKIIQEYISKYKQLLEEFLNFMAVDKDVILCIIPVNFGSTFNFDYVINGSKLELYFTYRYDLGLKYLFTGLISSVVKYKLDASLNTGSLFQTNVVDWSKRQFLIDYLNRCTSLAKVCIATTSPTLNSLESLNQRAMLVSKSHTYLRELGFDRPTEMEVLNGQLIINEQKIYLTNYEEKIMKHLLVNKGSIVSFDSLGDILWEDDLEKFSIGVLSKHLSNVRCKINNSGYMGELLYISRGNGVLLEI